MQKLKKDILIIGSGIAGLTCALKLPENFKIAIITKSKIKESSTFYAQGGIAAVSSSEDSFLTHIEDTLTAGDGLCDRNVVEKVVERAPQLIDDLIKWGIDFTRFKDDRNSYDLTKEGGHTKRRIYHKDDMTGEEIESKLVANILNKKNVEIFENRIAINLITTEERGKIICNGAHVLDKMTGEVITFETGSVILASGGSGKVYLYTSNPDIASGDGVAMAYRAGAEISNMEFIQFHPTCLYHKDAKSFLISESMRGEGAVLKLQNGEEFMRNYHKLRELAPRDIVARSIDSEMKKLGIPNVFLDISFKDANFVKERFPNIYEKCKTFGFDITKEPIPVVPAAHYTCGGVKTDIHGRTNLENLFAIGEVACTGLHGANRLASNSLLEALFFSQQVAVYLSKNFTPSTHKNIEPWNKGSAVDSNELIMIQHNWEEIRRLMWNYVGIVRSKKRLMRAKRRIELLISEIQEYYWDFTITSPLLELRNLATVAKLIIESASRRKESRGLHFNLDYPSKLHEAKDTILSKKIL